MSQLLSIALFILCLVLLIAHFKDIKKSPDSNG